MTRSTTVVGVLKGGCVAVAADGQVTMGDATILKHTAKKVRRLAGGKVLCGFAGAVADAQALQDRFETKLDAFNGNLKRAAIEFAKDWRTDKVLRHLNALMIAADAEALLVISGDGNVIEPDDGVAGIGSGGAFALAAARALLKHTDLSATQIAEQSLQIASEICVYTNDQINIETLGADEAN
ncbi:MAG: ATP-dependent protease subunit HslV [Fimbriimonadaceae bacterium]|nr:ATP-dependent protease subunit HslV [Fimbriimonadaceae bacterium]QOJ12734.1 MAG: ATP-dependent protease subunit HslV [Chthonomonadaceae bacterium]